jgi:hypothetical protein
VAAAKYSREGCLMCDDSPGSESAGSAPGVRFPAELDGRWVGRYEQTDGRTWQLVLTIVGGQTEASVRYPEIPRAGVLTIVGATGSTLDTRERITDGACTPSGSMAFTLIADGRLSLAYRPDGADYTASAILARG